MSSLACKVRSGKGDLIEFPRAREAKPGELHGVRYGRKGDGSRKPTYLGLCRLLVEREACVNLCRYTTRDDLEDLPAELHELRVFVSKRHSRRDEVER